MQFAIQIGTNEVIKQKLHSADVLTAKNSGEVPSKHKCPCHPRSANGLPRTAVKAWKRKSMTVSCNRQLFFDSLTSSNGMDRMCALIGGLTH